MTTEELEKRIETLEASLAKAEEDKKTALGEKFKLAKDLKAAQDAAEEAVADAKAETGSELDQAKRQIAKLEKDLKAAQTEATTASESLRTIRVDNEITRSLSEHKARSEMSEALTALLKSKVAYEDGEATIEGKSIGEYVGSYLGSAAGAHFKQASDNSGSDATDSVKKANMARLNGRPSTPAEWDILDAMPAAERNAFADSINAPDLKV